MNDESSSKIYWQSKLDKNYFLFVFYLMQSIVQFNAYSILLGTDVVLNWAKYHSQMTLITCIILLLYADDNGWLEKKSLQKYKK